MRCPYCGGTNPDRASFCALCGRDLSVKTPAATSPRQAPPPPGRPTYPPSKPPTAPAVPPAPAGGRPAARPTAPPVTPMVRPIAPVQPIAIEAPASYPPRTVEHLKQLESEALPYTVLSDVTETGHKKMITIVYDRCAPWQQVATLMKALQELTAANLNTIVVQGFVNREIAPYRFTNGLLQFDRNVRLGSLTQNRYQIETGNGFDITSVRIVISE